MTKKYFLHHIGICPDIRLVFELVYGSEFNLALLSIESEITNPADRTWEWLFFRPKKSGEHGNTVSIENVRADPLIMEVESALPDVAALVSYFMKVETGCLITKDIEGSELFESSELLEDCSSLNPLERMETLKTSVWRKATLEDPYPSR